MRQFPHLSRPRPRRFFLLLVASLSGLAFLVPATLGSADSAAASPSAGYTASLIPTGEEGFWAAVDPDTNTAYIGDLAADELSVVDGSTNTVTGTIPLAAVPHGIAVDPATDTVYASVAGSTATSAAALDVIDGATDTVTDTIALPSGSDPIGVAVDSTTGLVFVAEYNASAVAVIDGSTNTVTATVSTGSGTQPYDVAVDETSGVVWVADWSGNVFGITEASNTITQTVSFSGANVAGIDVDPDTDTVYAAIESTPAVAVIDGSTGAVTTTISVTEPFYSVAVDPGSGTVFASSDEGSGSTGTTWVIDASSDTIVDTIQRGGYLIAVDTATGSAYVAAGTADQTAAWVLTPSAANAMSPVIQSTTAATFTAGTAGTFTVTASALPAATYSETGALPSGVTLSSSGTLSGTPAAGTGGVYPITITASNGIPPDDPQAFTLTVDAAPTLTIPAAVTLEVGVPATIPIQVTGYPAPTLYVDIAPPSWLVLSELSSGSWELSGTPPVGSGGEYEVAFQPDNALGSAYATMIITVQETPTFSSADQATFIAGGLGTFAITAAAYPAATFSESGALPAGVTLAADGILSGTPAAGTAGSYPVTVTATNSLGSATQQFTLTVVEQPFEVQASQQSGYCLDNTGGLASDGNPIQVWYCLGNANQGWEYVPQPNGVAGDFQLENSNGLCLDDPADSAVNGTRVQLWSCLGDASQQWTAVTADGIFTEYVNANGLCLDNTGNATTDGNLVQVWACSGDAAQHWYGPSPQSSEMPPAYQVQASQASGFCLDNTGGRTQDGNPIQIWSCLGNANQIWEYVPSVNGMTGDFQLENDDGLCLDDPNDSAVNGTRVQLWSCLGDASQQWTQVTVGSYTEYVNANGVCLDNTGDALSDGNRVQVWACNGDVAQQWYGPNAESGPH